MNLASKPNLAIAVNILACKIGHRALDFDAQATRHATRVY